MGLDRIKGEGNAGPATGTARRRRSSSSARRLETPSQSGRTAIRAGEDADPHVHRQLDPQLFTAETNEDLRAGSQGSRNRQLALE